MQGKGHLSLWIFYHREETNSRKNLLKGRNWPSACLEYDLGWSSCVQSENQKRLMAVYTLRQCYDAQTDAEGSQT